MESALSNAVVIQQGWFRSNPVCPTPFKQSAALLIEVAELLV